MLVFSVPSYLKTYLATKFNHKSDVIIFSFYNAIMTDPRFAFFSKKNGTGDLQKKNVIELKEMLERQNHLLANKFLINKLKDQGEKIRKTRDVIAQELNCRKLNKQVHKNKSFDNSNSLEWRKSKDEDTSIDVDDVIEKDDKDVMKILSQNGQVKKEKMKPHLQKLLEKETDAEFSFKPFNPAVVDKIKNIIPGAHTEVKLQPSIKTIHLEESLHLLTEQMSSLKLLGSQLRRRRVEDCIGDRMNESCYEPELEEEEDEEFDSRSEIIVNASN